MSANDILVPISPGELIDKITILRIKSARIEDPAKLANVRRELEALEATWRKHPFSGQDIRSEEQALQQVNERLWQIEDDIRDRERMRSFDAEFIRLARAVYVQNDERAAIKKQINQKLGSTLVEEKSYRDYRG